MNKRLLPFFFLGLLALPPLADARPVLTPPVIGGGGVSLVRWHGEEPASIEVLFRGEKLKLRPEPAGGIALLGVDMETAPGSYPVIVSGRNGQGEAFGYTLTLDVIDTPRREERLTLPPEKVTPREPEVLQRIAREQALLTKIFAGGDRTPVWERFSRPVADPLGSPFGLRRILNGEPRSPHAGIDFRSPRGTPVLATARGMAVFAGDLFFTGKTVILDHGGGLFSLYAHLEDFLCSEGEPLERGTVLGRVGSSGRSTGPHLHWGFKYKGERIDPMAILDLLSASRLD